MSLEQLRGYLWLAGASYRMTDDGGMEWSVPFPLSAAVQAAVERHWDSLAQLARSSPDFTINGQGVPTDSDSDSEGRPC